MAFLAALPKAPNNYNPFRFPEAAKARRDWVLDRMAEDHAITPEQARDGEGDADPARRLPSPGPDPRRRLVHRGGAPPAGRPVRRRPHHHRRLHRPHQPRPGAAGRGRQGAAGRADGLRPEPWRLARAGRAISTATRPCARAGATASPQLPRPPGMLPEWRLAVALQVDAREAKLGWIERPPGQPAGGRHVAGRDDVPVRSRLGAPGARRRQPRPVAAADGRRARASATWSWSSRSTAAPGRRQGRCPARSPAAAAGPAGAGRAGLHGSADRPRAGDGRRLELRAEPVQPRHPGRAAARQLVQADGLPDRARIRASRRASGCWTRRSSRGRRRASGGRTTTAMTFSGPTPMRIALERSLNLVTVRLADKVGMDAVAQNAIAFHVVDGMPKVLPAALGAVETTVLRQASAYAGLAMGGREVLPSLVDSVQDRDGKVIWRPSGLECRGCGDPAKPPSDRRQPPPDRRPAQRRPARHHDAGRGGQGDRLRRRRRARPRHRRQDRHHPGFRRRLVRRLHARTWSPPSGSASTTTTAWATRRPAAASPRRSGTTTWPSRSRTGPT